MKLISLTDNNLPSLSFDDVLLEPRLSDVFPEDVSLENEFIKGLTTQIPIISAHMPTVASVESLISMNEIGAVGTLHRDMPIDELESNINELINFQIDIFKYSDAVTTDKYSPVPIVACSPLDTKRAEFLLNNSDVNYVIFDNVQPLHINMIKNTEYFSSKYPNKIILGNIATEEGARIYSDFPLAALKVGLGPGSICTTRLISGCGVSQLTAIAEVAKITCKKNIPLIADGGIRSSGDIVKALAAGADGVMLGNLLAGCEESPGKIIQHNGNLYKEYEGARYNSVEIPFRTGYEKIDKYLETSRNESYRIEGASGLVPYKGPIHLVIYNLIRGVRLGFGFVGAKNIKELRKKAVFRHITTNSYYESKDNMPIRTSESFFGV